MLEETEAIPREQGSGDWTAGCCLQRPPSHLRCPGPGWCGAASSLSALRITWATSPPPQVQQASHWRGARVPPQGRGQSPAARRLQVGCQLPVLPTPSWRWPSPGPCLMVVTVTLREHPLIPTSFGLQLPILRASFKLPGFSPARFCFHREGCPIY